MAEHPNVEMVRSAYAAFATGDLDAVLANLADDCIFHFGGEGPNSGDHQGRDAITAAIMGLFELTAGTQRLDVKSVYADDHHGAVVLHETATRPDGASLDMDEVHVLALRDGKLTHLWDLPTDPAVHDAFFDGN
jgi:ketosteroid isomerase-like protein